MDEDDVIRRRRSNAYIRVEEESVVEIRLDSLPFSMCRNASACEFSTHVLRIQLLLGGIAELHMYAPWLASVAQCCGHTVLYGLKCLLGRLE